MFDDLELTFSTVKLGPKQHLPSLKERFNEWLNSLIRPKRWNYREIGLIISSWHMRQKRFPLAFSVEIWSLSQRFA